MDELVKIELGMLHQIRDSLRAAFYAHHKQQKAADELIDKIDGIIKEADKCSCYEPGHWFLGDGAGTCNGTKEREPCYCEGKRSRCDYYGEERTHESADS